MPRSQDRLHSGTQKVMLERDLSNWVSKKDNSFLQLHNYRRRQLQEGNGLSQAVWWDFVILLRIHRPDIYAYICACIHIYLHLYMDMSISNIYIHTYIFNFSVDNWLLTMCQTLFLVLPECWIFQSCLQLLLGTVIFFTVCEPADNNTSST